MALGEQPMTERADGADGQDLFICPKCRTSYVGTYKVGIVSSRGTFKCDDCEATVHTWNGVRDYFKWDEG